MLHIFWIFILAAVSISSSCLCPPPPEICRLLFALVPFNVSPSPSPPCPPRAPRGPSSVLRIFDQSRCFHMRSDFSPPFAYVTGASRNLTRRPSGESSTKPYSLHISASAAEQPAKQPAKQAPFIIGLILRGIGAFRSQEEQTDDPNKRICLFFIPSRCET